MCICAIYSFLKEGIILADFEYKESTKKTAREIREERQKKRKRQLVVRRTVLVAIPLLIITVLVLFIVGLCNRACVPQAENKTTKTVTAKKVETPEYLKFNKPNIQPVKDATKDEVSYISENSEDVFIYDKKGLLLYADEKAKSDVYCAVISEFKEALGDQIKVYDMVIPGHVEYALPKEVIDSKKVKTSDQSEAIKYIYSHFDKGIQPINVYNKLSEHNNEYIFFNTEKYWTGLGAYYGYAAFCEQTGLQTLNLEVCKERKIHNFEGSLISCDSSLADNLDTVSYYTLPYNTHAIREEDGEREETTIYYEGEDEGEYSYYVFIWGDAPLFIEYNDDLKNGENIAVVKESTANDFVPYLTANFKEVHVIDYNYFEGNLKDYCKENNISRVLFMNSINSTKYDIEAMEKLLK